jgi:signal transduction histidine kinase/PAS domain-containing protein
MLESTSPGAVRVPAQAEVGFTLERLEWLVRLRWMALLGIVIAAIFAAAGAFPGVNVPVLFATAAAATLYNTAMWRDLQEGRAATDQRAAIQHAMIDFMLLTIVLWAAGGLESPFVSYYVFHVTLVGILFGPRATLLAAGVALACAGLLWTTEVVPALRIARWHPEGMWGPFATVVAFVSTLASVAYLVNHAAAELRDRERALEQARDRAELEYELLSTTLDELDAGLEVLDAEHNIVWRNRRAQQLVPHAAVKDVWRCPGTERPCERDVSGVCPIERSLSQGEAGRCKFAFGQGGPERVYELLSFPLSAPTGDKPRVMNLYLDRTNATLAERQLLLAERLASLGRVAQGVAHELNTPLATIRTLAADMGVVLPTVPDAPPEQRAALVRDVAESAALIKEETARLGRITHALLAGGDLVRVRVQGAVPLGAVVERACALVFAGVRAGANVELDRSLDGVRLRCDQDRLLQVLVNLLQNAHDALRNDPAAAGEPSRPSRNSKIGSVRVSAQVEEGFVTLRVEDDGPGIDPSLEGRLFEPFTTTKPVGEGTGLGLYTSYMLVRAMHGTLTLENRVQGGARASLTLPLDNAHGDAQSGAVSERGATRPGAG